MTDNKITKTARILYPILSVLFYIIAIAVAVLLILSFIILFIDVESDSMLLPAIMKRIKEGYSIYMGDGVNIFTPIATMSQIKTVCYITIFSFIVLAAVILPIIRFLSMIAKNIKSGDITNPKNSLYTIYIGLSVMILGTFREILGDYFNYKLFDTFVNEATGDNLIGYSFDLNFGTILFGLAIMSFGCIYGRLCEKNQTALAEAKDEERIEND